MHITTASIQKHINIGYFSHTASASVISCSETITVLRINEAKWPGIYLQANNHPKCFNTSLIKYITTLWHNYLYVITTHTKWTSKWTNRIQRKLFLAFIRARTIYEREENRIFNRNWCVLLASLRPLPVLKYAYNVDEAVSTCHVDDSPPHEINLWTVRDCRCRWRVVCGLSYTISRLTRSIHYIADIAVDV